MLDQKLEQLKVSIVIACARTRTSCRQFIEQDSYTGDIVEAKSGSEGLAASELFQPDVILLDCRLPDYNALEFIHQLKTRSIKLPQFVLFKRKQAEIEEPIAELKLQTRIYLISARLTAKVWHDLAEQIARSLPSRALAESVQQQQLITDTALRIRKSLSLKFIFDRASEESTNFLTCDRLSIVRLTTESIAIESAATKAEEGEKLPPLTTEDFYPVELDSIATRIEREELWVPIILEQALESSPHHPLWGWLVAQRQYIPWQTTEQSFLEQLSIQLSIALSQKSLFQQLQNSDRQLKISNISNQKLKKLSFKDPLTQVYNRRYFKQQLNKEWFRLRRSSSPLSIILCDIDYFKLYNDTYGHQQGDVCLEQVAEAMSSIIKRPADIFARYGGEEFVAILPETERRGAVKIAEKMRTVTKKLAIPHSTSAIASVVTVSIGVATIVPHADDNPGMLIQAADDALYLAKNRGRDCIAVHQQYAARLDDRRKSDSLWAKRIRYALEKDLFQLYLQPIVALKECPKRRFEVLLRLVDRGEGEAYPPHLFFAAAERNCLMSNIDTWVVNQLLKQISLKGDSLAWQDYQFSINLSGASLNDREFLDFLSRRLSQYHLSPQLFCFEITEDVAIANIKQIGNFIVSLKKLGCSFALDDFGKGMSSLTYLKNLPIDYLKIDGSFITELNKDKVSLVMVEAIEHLAKGIGLKTVAEYVESQEILDTLKALDVDYVQGYFLGRPQKFCTFI